MEDKLRLQVGLLLERKGLKYRFKMPMKRKNLLSISTIKLQDGSFIPNMFHFVFDEIIG